MLLLVLVMSACGSRKKTVVVVPETPPVPTWHTAFVTNTVAALEIDGRTYNSNCMLQTVRDSLIIASIMPMLNMEMIRLELTPDTIIAIDKVNRRYTRVAMAQAEKHVVPAIRWSDLQDFAAGEGVQQGETAALGYTFRHHTVKLTLTYGPIYRDVPVNARNLNTARYQFVDINTLLNE